MNRIYSSWLLSSNAAKRSNRRMHPVSHLQQISDFTSTDTEAKVSQVHRNVLANLAGQLWATLMGFAFVPVYVHMIGIEAFGVIGLFATLMAAAAIFDFGLTGTINRELARRVSLQPNTARNLVRSLESLVWPIGVLLGLLVWAASAWVASAWLNPVDLSPAETRRSVALMGLVLFCLWPAAFYLAGINALQRQVISNTLLVVFSTLRNAGAVLALWAFGESLTVFFLWQAAIGLLQTIVQALTLWRLLPASGEGAEFRLSELRAVVKFAAGVSLVSLTSFAITQLDKVMLSRLLSLELFGIYALAATVASVFSRAVQPWFSAMYPRFSELHAKGDTDGLVASYHTGSQWVAVTVLPAAAVAILYAKPLLALWTQNPALAQAAAPAAAVLVAGAALNALMNLPYALQLACGWVWFSVRVNSVATCLMIPALAVLIPRFGLMGAAVVWFLYNLGLALIALPLMHRKILPDELRRWYLRDIGPSLLLVAVTALVLKSTVPSPQATLPGVAFLLAATSLLTVVSFLASERPRNSLLLLVRRSRAALS